MGMVGGGKGAFIGAVHRISAQLDNQIELVCGAFSSDPVNSVASGKALYLDEQRCYASYQEMFEKERELGDDGMDMVAIVTPNHLHFPIAKMALEHGFHVMSDKPATVDLSEALALKEIIEQTGLLYGLTHTYTGYPMVKEAKARIKKGLIGKVKKVVVEYPQGWLANKSDEQSKQAAWRLDPKTAGISCCMGDIGVHAANLAEYVTGLEITNLCAELSSNVSGRVLDDDGSVLLRFNNGAQGVLLASQISVGEENSLKLRVYGETASIEWSQLEPNSVWMKFADKPSQLIRAGVGEMDEITQANMRTPAGHPEGYLEAFANIYTQFSYQIRSRLFGLSEDVNIGAMNDVPGINTAIRGMAFIENVVAASQSELKWHPFLLTPQILTPQKIVIAKKSDLGK
ncbi:Gfo/Idh/MocA family oxidoreductase [Colwellia echini]|uniref:Gfo/Idh/MocA family oxidoreductase n=2 Tax=Colwellia echini TaxID=1982103 RepID=A0ABY3MUL6_9GAMM|nr:Gfo/Idh/MocA family oxidoreductase [Colwellia echini]